MKSICFLRHGDADWPNWDKPDDERPLTKAGRKEVKRMGKLLARLKFLPEAILTSPLPRAEQTAKIAGKQIGVAVEVEPELAKRFSLERLRAMVAKANVDCIMLVGHEPDFSDVLRELTGSKLKLSKAGVAVVEVNADCTAGTLLWLIPPKLAKAASN